MSNQPQASHRSYFPALDGLRGVACIIVVAYHLFPFIYQYLFFGWLAMDIFFVLSGYLITDILIKTIGSKNSVRNFYARRLLRVFPLYYVAMILFLLILPNLVHLPFATDYFTGNQVYFWTFLQNWLLILHPHPTQSYLNHLWTMAVEEQFYLIWPIIFIVIRKPRVLIALLSVLLLSFIVFRFWIWTQHIEGLNYFNLYSFTRIDGICIGCMVALLQQLNTQFLGRYMALIVSSFALLNFIFYFINLHYGNSFPFIIIGFSTFSMIFGLLVYDIVNQRTKIFSTILSIRPLKFVGNISYGTYLFHWPLYLILGPILVRWVHGHFSEFYAQLFASIVICALSYVVGYLSYRYFEMPFLRLKKHFT